LRMLGRSMMTLWLIVGVLSLMAATGCGAGSGVMFPPPTGNFSNASLKGQYVYEMHGMVAGQVSTPYREFGFFTADGAGRITSGTDDYTSTNTAGVSSSSITGTYNVGPDGTGFISIGPAALATTVNVSQVTFAITLVSSSKIQLIEADSFADGAGVSELQDPATLTTTPSGTFVFRLHQSISTQAGGSSAAQVGAITASGGSFSGNMDQNLGGTTSQLSISNGTLNAPISGRGTGTFTDSSNITTTFIYYVVNSGKIALLVSTPSAVGSGTAELQSGAVGNGLSGNYAFGSRGDDSFFDGTATVGQFTASSGTISGVEDSVQDGNYSANLNISSCFNAAATGRVVVDNCSGAASQIFWMVNPSRALFLDVNATTVEDGSADAQTATPFPSTLNSQFALVMDGGDFTLLGLGSGAGVLARVGVMQFRADGKVNLTELANDSLNGGGAANPGGLAGNYQISTSTGRIVASFGGGSLNLVMYGVSTSQVYALQTDIGVTTSGSAELQH